MGAAVRRFQADIGLAADGIVGPETFSAIKTSRSVPVERVLGLWSRLDGVSRPEALVTVLAKGLAATTISGWKGIEAQGRGAMFWSPAMRSGEGALRPMCVEPVYSAAGLDLVILEIGNQDGFGAGLRADARKGGGACTCG